MDVAPFSACAPQRMLDLFSIKTTCLTIGESTAIAHLNNSIAGVSQSRLACVLN